MIRAFAISLFMLSMVCTSFCANARSALKSSLLRKADKVFGARYVPSNEKPLRSFDPEKDFGPPDQIYYRHGKEFVVILTFAMDDSLARVALVPEGLLYTDDGSVIPEESEIDQIEMPWLIDRASQLRRIGKAAPFGNNTSGLCFESGANSYCSLPHEFASVSTYWREVDKRRLKQVSIAYLQSIAGVITKTATAEDGGVRLKIDSRWFQIAADLSGLDKERMTKGSKVKLYTYGCAGNERNVKHQATLPSNGRKVKNHDFLGVKYLSPAYLSLA